MSILSHLSKMTYHRKETNLASSYHQSKNIKVDALAGST